jgi:hypothetical protein
MDLPQTASENPPTCVASNDELEEIRHCSLLPVPPYNPSPGHGWRGGAPPHHPPPPPPVTPSPVPRGSEHERDLMVCTSPVCAQGISCARTSTRDLLNKLRSRACAQGSLLRAQLAGYLSCAHRSLNCACAGDPIMPTQLRDLLCARRSLVRTQDISCVRLARDLMACLHISTRSLFKLIKANISIYIYIYIHIYQKKFPINRTTRLLSYVRVSAE